MCPAIGAGTAKREVGTAYFEHHFYGPNSKETAHTRQHAGPGTQHGTGSTLAQGRSTAQAACWHRDAARHRQHAGTRKQHGTGSKPALSAKH
jgi:hypothetical protein